MLSSNDDIRPTSVERKNFSHMPMIQEILSIVYMFLMRTTENYPAPTSEYLMRREIA